jgi:hypothetical protein
MNTPTFAARKGIRLGRWLALPASAGLGLALAAVLLAVLAPRAGVAAAAPTVAYSCDELGLDAALGAGGSATFTCGSPTTVTLSSRKLVTQDVALDGENLLTLSGGGVTGVFSVPAGVHLNVQNLTLFNAGGSLYGGAIFNAGVATISHTHFLSNSASAGSALFNAGGGAAHLSNSLVDNNVAEAGAVWSGDAGLAATASLTIAHTTFENNTAIQGAAVVAAAGPVWITDSTFLANRARLGGAIFVVSNLRVDNSDFSSNTAIPLFFQLNGPSLLGPGMPAGGGFTGGGAIAIQQTGDVVVAGSHFTGNIGGNQAGAILLRLGGVSISAFSGHAAVPAGSAPGALVISGSTFVANCTGGSGGAIANSLTTTVINSSFSLNHADADGFPCLASQAALDTEISGRPAQPDGVLFGGLMGAGGAIYNFSQLSVSGSTFLSNTASVTTAGGGGAIANYAFSEMHVDTSQFFDNEALNDGGAIFSDYLSSSWISGSDFQRNSAENDSGGALASVGSVTVTASSFTANDSGSNVYGPLGGGGGAIFTSLPFNAAGQQPANGPAGSLSSSLLVDHSTFISNASEYEGGALDAANATIIASTFVSNTAAYGGAIDVLLGGFTISGSTFIANAVVTTTLERPQEGGAIDTNGHAVTVINSTFYANRATGEARGGAINGASLILAGHDPVSTTVITNSTFLSNSVETDGYGGALGNNGGFVLHNVLIAHSAGGNCEYTMTLSSPNLEYPGVTCGGASVQADPQALPPADNGGPTLTSALLPGSPAIDAGDNAGCPATDQRGVQRPVNGDGLAGADCDLGAFEALVRLFLPLLMR